MNRYHKFLSSILAVLILLSLPAVSSAAPVTQDVQGFQVTPAPASATNIISDYGCGVINGGDGTIILEGRTSSMGYGVVDMLRVKVYLQRWNGSSWINVTSRTYTDYDTDVVDDFDAIPVSPGKYRAIASHNATDDSLTDSRSSSSGSITIY